MQVKSYEKEIRVYQYECDMKSRMTAAALLKQVQQVSMEHCDAFGLDAKRYQETNTAFLLSKISLIFNREIVAGEKLRLFTRPSLPVRAVYHRYTDALDEQGSVAASVDSRWILVDLGSRRILRRPPEELQFPFLDQELPEHPCKIEKAEELFPAGIQKALYSQVDQNGHLNNTEYASIACDALPLELMIEKPVKEIVVAYHSELLLGEKMELLMGKNGTGYYVRGDKAGKPCFEASVSWM